MNYQKYPRTFHLPWSKGRTHDDKVLSSMNGFLHQEVVVTEKMDGENTTCYPDGYVHSRSVAASSHWSRTWIKNFWAERCFLLNANYRLCGENLYAKHSVAYSDLKSFFYGFSVWNNDLCLSWNETLMWFEELKIEPVPVLYRGLYDERELQKITKNLNHETTEGFVVRLTRELTKTEFSSVVGKFVRENHVTTDQHWMTGPKTVNGLESAPR